MLVYVALVVGCLLLYKGGDWLLEGMVDFGEHLGWPKAITGLLLVSLGTSAPELFVSVGAALQGQGAVAAGNIVGSNIINMAIVLGIAGSVATLSVERVLQGQLLALLAVSTMAAYMLFDGEVSRIEGITLLVSIVISFAVAFRADRHSRLEFRDESEDECDKRTKRMSVLMALGGLVTLLIGAEAMIWGGLELAQRHAIPKAVVALTVTALGTSLPEIAATVVAVTKGESSLALGNVVGSNLLNLGFVMGLSALIMPLRDIDIDTTSIAVSVGLTAAITTLGIGVKRIPRIAGGALILSYAMYVVVLAT